MFFMPDTNWINEFLQTSQNNGAKSTADLSALFDPYIMVVQ